MSEVREKRCSKCGNTKPITEFWKDSSRADGYENRCKTCSFDKKKQWQSVPGRNRYSELQSDLKQQTPKWADSFRMRLMYETAAKMRAAGGDWELDHVIPVSATNHAGKHIASGLHTHENLRFVDSHLNRFKGAHSWEMFMPDIYGERYWRPDWPAEGAEA
jgi:hypothetical protein